eukprot:GFYU01001248.1.p1 GENE.GFYU01001248.1~~GFYU01001248.1.p1  ORF type:complete len:318 (+),score=65.05 GFYU01001248.1:108-1061(+)
MTTPNKKLFGPQGWTPEKIDSLVGKTFVITGANTGAGFQATRVLLDKGGSVVMLNRNPKKSTAAIEELKDEFGENVKVTFIKMDLAALDSVREAATEVLNKVPRIDALICNGAIAQVPKQALTIDGFESQLGVNHFGHFLLCGMLFDRVEESEGRVVVVGSNAYRMGLKRIKFEDLNFDRKYTPWSSYAQSKLAQIMFAYELQRRVQAAGKKVKVFVCHPGASRTNLLQDTAGWFLKCTWNILQRLIAQSAEKGAWPEVMCATEGDLEQLALYGPTSRDDTVGPVGQCKLLPLALDTAMAEQLWTVSEEKTGLSWQP